MCVVILTASDPEVRGGLHVKLARFPSPLADLWALGVIPMNLVCGCLPWAKASLSDPHFATYVLRDQDYLYHTFPITRELNELFKGIFTTDPRRRLAIAEIRRRVSKIRAFSDSGLARVSMASERYASDDTFASDTDFEDDLDDIVAVP